MESSFRVIIRLPFHAWLDGSLFSRSICGNLAPTSNEDLSPTSLHPLYAPLLLSFDPDGLDTLRIIVAVAVGKDGEVGEEVGKRSAASGELSSLALSQGGQVQVVVLPVERCEKSRAEAKPTAWDHLCEPRRYRGQPCERGEHYRRGSFQCE